MIKRINFNFNLFLNYALLYLLRMRRYLNLTLNPNSNILKVY